MSICLTERLRIKTTDTYDNTAITQYISQELTLAFPPFRRENLAYHRGVVAHSGFMRVPYYWEQ